MRLRTGSLYKLEPVGCDSWDKRVVPWRGTVVKVVQPHGCPRNGTMGHCFVESRTGDFIGLVLCNSLQPLDNKTRPGQ